jgi:RNA-directed DNA polymerase
MKVYKNLYKQIISKENLFEAWEIFKRDKRNRHDVETFEKNIEREIFKLAHELQSKSYRHGMYRMFLIHDPKLRQIHKATVRDRVLHHAIFKILNPIFEQSFIPASFSCRIGKGTHKGVEYLARALRAVSKNDTISCFVLKCDIRKFFDSVDHNILLGLLEKRIVDADTRWLMREIVGSFTSLGYRERESKNAPRKGVPIGNLTSQLFANIYMNELDQFVKHELRVKYYARYTDDFVIVSEDQEHLESLIPRIGEFLHTRLALSLHPNKVSIRKYRHGIDFLGYIVLSRHIAVRRKTEKRIFRKLRERVRGFRAGSVTNISLLSSLKSYLGILSHADAHEVVQELKNKFWFWLKE